MLSVIWFVTISILSSNVLADCVAGLGFLVCIYYGFTGFACTVFYRQQIFKSVRNFVNLALMPTLGGLALMGVLGYGLYYYGQSANDSSPPFLGLGVPDWIAILGVGGGVILVTHPPSAGARRSSASRARSTATRSRRSPARTSSPPPIRCCEPRRGGRPGADRRTIGRPGGTAACVSRVQSRSTTAG